MAIQHRRGDYLDYKPSKMLSGEIATTLQNDPRAVDGKAIHAAFAPGDEKTLMTFEDAELQIEQATEVAIEAATSRAETAATNAATSETNANTYKNQAANSATSASGSASTATTKASEASNSATTAANHRRNAEAWARGTKDGTPVTSSDEQYENNAKYYAEQAGHLVTVDSAMSDSSPNAVQNRVIKAYVDDVKAVMVNMGTISSLPVTKTAVGVSSDMVLGNAWLGTPSAQTSGWTVTTNTNEVIITSNDGDGISGSTTLTLLLIPQSGITAT